MFLRIQDKAFNPDHVTHFVYSHGDGPSPAPSLAIFLIGGKEISFGADYAEMVWWRLAKGAEVLTHEPAAVE